jgi:hypothetical protein
MNKYTLSLSQLIDAMPGYSRQGVINLVIISIKYRNILEEIASVGIQFREAIKTLKATADAIKLSTVQIDIFVKNAQKKILFNKVKAELTEQITGLLSLIDTHEVSNN